MKILEVKSLSLPEIKIIRFGRFPDFRGYFSETFRKSDVPKSPELSFLEGFDFVQSNESYSRKGVIKGLHFQWDPPLGKLLRTISGHMVDMILDIRKNSPTQGKIIMYDLPARTETDFNEWIFIPPGFAHGSYFMEDSLNEYFFSANYNPKGEAGISPLTADLDWSLCDPELKLDFEKLVQAQPLINDKDRTGLSFGAWQQDSRSENFIHKNV